MITQLFKMTVMCVLSIQYNEWLEFAIHLHTRMLCNNSTCFCVVSLERPYTEHNL